MRVLWHSNAPWVGSGYGVQTRLILKQLLERGHDPTAVAYYGLRGGVVEYDGYPCLPASNYDDWGNDVIEIHATRARAELIVTLLDVFVLSPEVWGRLEVPWAAWVPIDSFTIGEMTSSRLALAKYPIAMSNFGAEQMRGEDIVPVATIPHAVDTQVFQPLDKYECRAELGIPDDVFLVGMVMANKGNRKQFPLQLLAIKNWMEKEGHEEVRVYLHTEPTAQMAGYDMRHLVDKIGLKGKVYTTNQYDASVVPLPFSQMAKVYNAFDVLMNCSTGEGFGVPIIEAQSCGIPVIATNFSAMPEIVQNGYCVEVKHPEMGLHMGWMAVPDVEDMIYRLECVYRMKNNETAAVGRAAMIENFDWWKVGSMWDELLKEIAEDNKVLRKGKTMVLS